MRILLVEDDELLGDSIRVGMNKYHYIVDWEKNGLAAWNALQTECFDLVILDLNLPKLSGHEVLEKMRAKNIATPVIILTGCDSIDSRIKELDSGADDYITKPFDLEELCARIRAVRKRTIPQAQTNAVLAFDNIKLDPTTRLVFRAGEMVELSRREFILLQILIENSDKVIPHEQVMQCLYGWDRDIDSNTIEVHISNLRKKLKFKNINTIRGIGYMLNSN